MARSESPSPLQRWAPWAFVLLALGVGATTALEVAANHVSVPYQDAWSFVELWRARLDGRLDLAMLFSQHNEHRPVVGRLAALADYAWFDGRSVLLVVLIGLIQVAAALLYVRAAAAGGLAGLSLAAAGLAAALCLTLMQWENLFWGFQVPFVGVFAGGAWAIWLFCDASEPGRPVRWPAIGLAVVLIALGVYSVSNGVLAGAAILLTGLVARRRPAATLVVSAATALLAAAHFSGYHTVAEHSPMALASREPAAFVGYVLAYLGSPWRLDFAPAIRIAAAQAAGLVGALATLAMLVVLVRTKRPDAARSAMFGITLFIGMTAGVTALGRLGFGPEQALSSRYVTAAAHFWAAQAVFWALSARTSPARWPAAALAGTFTIAGVLLVRLQVTAATNFDAHVAPIRAAESALVTGLDDANLFAPLYPTPDVVRSGTPLLRVQRLGPFADAPPLRRGDRFDRRLAPAAGCPGHFDAILPAGAAGSRTAHGWAWDRDRAHAFRHGALVDAQGRVAGVAVSGAVRRDVAQALRDPRALRAGWVGALPPGGGPLAAYGLYPDGRACPLGQVG